MTITISNKIHLADDEVVLSAIRAQGSGGQNVNKVSTAIHLRFDINSSSLPEEYKERLLSRKDNRITADGIVIIKAQQFRSQLKNRENAISRLIELIQSIGGTPRKRRATRPAKAAREKRLKQKNIRSTVKNLRRKVES